MKIVLVQPPVEDFYFTPHRSSTLGLQSLAAVWIKKGHDCQILNFPLEKPHKKKIPIPEKLEYLYPYLKKHPKEIGGTSYFSNYYRFGSSIAICVDRIKELEPQVVAVSCFAWSYAQSTQNLLELLREEIPPLDSPLLVVGGPGVTVMPGYFTPFADLVIKGEGENVIEEIEKMVLRITTPGHGEIIGPDPPQTFPFVWNIRKKRKNQFFVSTMLSRGCPKMCSFCANHLVFGKSIRKITLSEVFFGIDQMIDQVQRDSGHIESSESSFPLDYSGIKLHINFEDDNILFQKDYFFRILKYVKGKCEQKGVAFSFSAENGMDYLLLSTETLETFKDLNLTQLNLSMASMDQRQLEGEKREGNLSKLESILDYSDKLGIPVITYFICGLKKDSPEKIVKTIGYLHGLETTIGISLYYPVPGLIDWQDKDLFLKIPAYLCCGSSAYSWNSSLSTRELVTAFRLARTSNYMKNCPGDKSKIEVLKKNLLDDETLDRPMVELFFGIR